jgi:ATP-dependent Zn proteases
MVTKYGMSDKMGPVALEGAGGRVLFGRGVEDGVYSDEVAAQIDAEVKSIMAQGMARAEETVKKHQKLLDAIAERLMETETIEREEFEQILVANGVVPKRKKDIEHQP